MISKVVGIMLMCALVAMSVTTALLGHQLHLSRQELAELRRVLSVRVAQQAAPPGLKEDPAITAVKEVILTQLRDPTGVIWGDLRLYDEGRIACGYLNAKNGFGGYAGMDRFMFAPEGGVELKYPGVKSGRNADLYVMKPETVRYRSVVFEAPMVIQTTGHDDLRRVFADAWRETCREPMTPAWQVSVGKRRQ